MIQMTNFLDLNLLQTYPGISNDTLPSVAGSNYSNPPHTLLETPFNYYIVMNLLGIDQKYISIRVDELKHEIVVLAKKEGEKTKRSFFWIFGVPSAVILDSVSTCYKAGILKITIPKYRGETVA